MAEAKKAVYIPVLINDSSETFCGHSFPFFAAAVDCAKSSSSPDVSARGEEKRNIRSVQPTIARVLSNLPVRTSQEKSRATSRYTYLYIHHPNQHMPTPAGFLANPVQSAPLRRMT